MSNSYNEFLEARVAVASFSITNSSSAQSLTSGVYIPTGALITGATLMCSATNLTANMSQTYQLQAGATAVMSVKSVKEIPAITVASALALSTTAGVYVSTAAELNLQVGSWTGTSVGHAEPTVYVGFVV
jgi:hypothetical protein